jgi:hypothetical protein
MSKSPSCTTSHVDIKTIPPIKTMVDYNRLKKIVVNFENPILHDDILADTIPVDTILQGKTSLHHDTLIRFCKALVDIITNMALPGSDLT